MDSFEKKLLTDLKRGDRESFTTLFERYSGRVYCLALRMCGNKETAEDILQQTFMQAFAGVGGFRGESGMYTWLYTITKNNCLRFLENRKKSTFSSFEELISVGSHAAGDDYDAVEKRFYISQVKEGCLLGLLRCLSLPQRMAFILHVLLDIDVKDTAAILDKTETAARLLIHRAKRNIRDFLCRNCSLYHGGNPCRCENLIGFSLKQGWLLKMSATTDTPSLSAPDIEAEIGQLEKLTALYKSLEHREPSIKIMEKIRTEIKNSPLLIFSDKKVK